MQLSLYIDCVSFADCVLCMEINFLCVKAFEKKICLDGEIVESKEWPRKHRVDIVFLLNNTCLFIC